MFDSAMAFLQSLQGFPAYALLFALLFSCGIGAPINEDILLLAAAALTLTLKGVMEPVPLMVVAWFGLVERLARWYVARKQRKTPKG